MEGIMITDSWHKNYGQKRVVKVLHSPKDTEKIEIEKVCDRFCPSGTAYIFTEDHFDIDLPKGSQPISYKHLCDLETKIKHEQARYGNVLEGLRYFERLAESQKIIWKTERLALCREMQKRDEVIRDLLEDISSE